MSEVSDAGLRNSNGIAHLSYKISQAVRKYQEYSRCVSRKCLHFFFSSRRRHTRFDCDWSSDVCSSDLTMRDVVMTFDVIKVDGIGDAWLLIQVHQVSLQVGIIDNAPQVAFEMAVINRRSEERRGGKGCRFRCRRNH